jgi:hypothetical protein
MQSSLDGFLHEATVVYRLVSFVEQFCIEQQSGQTYVSATTKFFGRVLGLTHLTKKGLSALTLDANRRAAEVHDPELDDDWYADKRGRLVTIKGFWKVLHRYLKPAADAHTLKIPAPLIEFATKQLQIGQ